MSKKQPPLKSTKPPLGSSLPGGFFWEKTWRDIYEESQKLYREPAPKNARVCRLRWNHAATNTALTVRAGQTKPHMHRDALSKGSSQNNYGKSEKQC